MSGSSSYTTSCKLADMRRVPSPRRRNVCAQPIGKGSKADESGFTIIELLLSVLILSIIIGLSTTTVRMFYAQSANVQNTYAATNQVLLASEILTEYTHDGVASCPAPTASPGDAACTVANGEQPFVTATSSSATFFADTDDVSNTSGPVEVSISLSGTTLTATVAQPTGGCPLTSTPTTVCSYGTARTIATVPNETNATPLSYLIGTGGPPPDSDRWLVFQCQRRQPNGRPDHRDCRRVHRPRFTAERRPNGRLPVSRLLAFARLHHECRMTAVGRACRVTTRGAAMKRRQGRSPSYFAKRSRDESGVALMIVMGIILMLSLGTAVMAQNVIAHVPIVQQDLAQHEAYRAMQSGIDEYLYEANANPNYIMCNDADV